MIGYLIYFDGIKSDDFINSPYNTRQDSFSDRVVRGKIMSADGQVLAQTNVSEDGTETRNYPYSNVFSHVVGYDSNGKSGLESEANFTLLTSHSFFLTQLKNEFLNTKNTGDTVISTLNANLQNVAYNALGDRRGAVVVIEPSTGKRLVEVSKPDFDPNTIAQNWQTLVNDENDSSLLNRATNGAYPPGSTFKVVTALDYFRTKGTFEGYNYLCEGSITLEDHTIHCYHNTVHGQEDFYSAFANSCNCAFASIGVDLGGASLRRTAEDLLFNKSLPLNAYRTSSFSLDKKSVTPLIMQTAIGQGNTLVSPMHMALITCAIANDGVLMKPYLIDHVESAAGEEVKKYLPSAYGNLMTAQEASTLSMFMRSVVTDGTGSGVRTDAYSVAGKTGSAEFETGKETHAWFTGFAPAEDPKLVVTVLVEEAGSGGHVAAPIAKSIFDTYFSR